MFPHIAIPELTALKAQLSFLWKHLQLRIVDSTETFKLTTKYCQFPLNRPWALNLKIVEKRGELLHEL